MTPHHAVHTCNNNDNNNNNNTTKPYKYIVL